MKSSPVEENLSVVEELFRLPSLHHSTSAADFAAWGVSAVVFVKRSDDLGDSVVWSLHAADGTQMGMAPSRDLAFAAIRQHEMEPFSVH